MAHQKTQEKKSGMTTASIIEKKESEVNDYNAGTVTYVHQEKKGEEQKSAVLMKHHPNPPVSHPAPAVLPRAAPAKEQYQAVEYGY